MQIDRRHATRPRQQGAVASGYAKEEATARKLRSWRVTILRNRAEYLGIVQAADERAAERAAIEAFALDEDRRKRLAVREE
jgi:hypothetical protein